MLKKKKSKKEVKLKFPEATNNLYNGLEKARLLNRLYNFLDTKSLKETVLKLKELESKM